MSKIKQKQLSKEAKSKVFSCYCQRRKLELLESTTSKGFYLDNLRKAIADLNIQIKSIKTNG